MLLHGKRRKVLPQVGLQLCLRALSRRTAAAQTTCRSSPAGQLKPIHRRSLQSACTYPVPPPCRFTPTCPRSSRNLRQKISGPQCRRQTCRSRPSCRRCSSCCLPTSGTPCSLSSPARTVAPTIALEANPFVRSFSKPVDRHVRIRRRALGIEVPRQQERACLSCPSAKFAIQSFLYETSGPASGAFGTFACDVPAETHSTCARNSSSSASGRCRPGCFPSCL